MLNVFFMEAQIDNPCATSNVTITPKDSTQITDPHLIETLDTGLYKIETNYGNGVDEEIVIYKTGN